MGWSAQSDTPSDLSRRISKISERWVGVHSQTLPVTLVGESARISERWVGVHSQALPVTLVGESARYLRDGLECTVRHSSDLSRRISKDI